MTYWWNNGNNCINFQFYPQHFKNFVCETNGVIKGKSKCFDFNLWILGMHFSYTDFNYNNWISQKE